jgi:hypothetical protein
MGKLNNYSGSIHIIDGLSPLGEDFPLMDAHSVQTREDGTRLDAELEKIGNSVQKYDKKNVLYGTDEEGNQSEYYLISHDDDDIPTSDWNKIVTTKEYMKLRHPSYNQGITPTQTQVNAGTIKGWYRVAERQQTYTGSGDVSGEGGCQNIFKVHCSGTGKGECDIVFAVNMAEWNATPAIAVLSYSYRTEPVITAIRVARESGKGGMAYLEVYLNVSPDASKLSTSKVAVRFKTEVLLYDKTRNWFPVYPVVSPEGTYLVTEKSALNSAWSSVTLGTDYINSIPTKLTELENKIGGGGGKLYHHYVKVIVNHYCVRCRIIFDTYSSSNTPITVDDIFRNSDYFSEIATVNNFSMEGVPYVPVGIQILPDFEFSPDYIDDTIGYEYFEDIETGYTNVYYTEGTRNSLTVNDTVTEV